MKKLMSLTLLGATLAVPIQSDGWVAVATTRHVAYGGACWHGGWSCGGVSTGTAVAAGVAGLAVGAAVGSAAAQGNQLGTFVAQPQPVVVVAVQPVPIGTVYYALPSGAQAATIAGQQYYYLGSTYYRPYFGNNGVYYQVVPFPI
jgi:uncharacterized protein DUF6515